MNLMCTTQFWRESSSETTKTRVVLSPPRNAYVCISAFTGGVDEFCGWRSQEVACCTHQPTHSPGESLYWAPVSRRHHRIGSSQWVMLCGPGLRFYIREHTERNTEHDLSGSTFTCCGCRWNPFGICMWHVKEFQTTEEVSSVFRNDWCIKHAERPFIWTLKGFTSTGNRRRYDWS